MKRIVTGSFLIAMLVLSGCTSSSSLYHWGSYQGLLYKIGSGQHGDVHIKPKTGITLYQKNAAIFGFYGVKADHPAKLKMLGNDSSLPADLRLLQKIEDASCFLVENLAVGSALIAE